MNSIVDIDSFIVSAYPTATPTKTAFTPSVTPTPANTPTPSNTPTFTPTTASAPTVTPTAIPTEPAPQPLQSAHYWYDGDGTMVKGIVNGTTTYYPGKHYNKEITNNIPKVQKFYIAGTMTIAVRTDGVLQWILPDHLGSTSTTANLDGTLNSVIQYTAFGEIRSTQGVTPTKYRYTGQLAQAELGLDYYISRWYDPLTGHFTQADTLIPEPGEAQAFDRYAYVQNNPLKYSDPSGNRRAGKCGDGGGCDRKDDKQIKKKFDESVKQRKGEKERLWFFENYKNGTSTAAESSGESGKPPIGFGSTQTVSEEGLNAFIFSSGETTSITFNQPSQVAFTTADENGEFDGFQIYTDYVFGGIDPLDGSFSLGFRTPFVGDKEFSTQNAYEYKYDPGKYGLDSEVTFAIYPYDIQRTYGEVSTEYMAGSYITYKDKAIKIGVLAVVAAGYYAPALSGLAGTCLSTGLCRQPAQK